MPVTLSSRDLRIVQMVTEGMRNDEIAIELGITLNVIRNYMKAIFDTTGMSSRLELALWYLEHEGEL